MSKILVDRELLERASLMELDTTRRSIKIQDELRAILAQPAEAEGDRIASGFVILDGMAFSKDEILAQRVDLCNALESLSAVTAERDRLRKDAARWRKCKTMPKAWWLEAMKEAGLKGGRGLDEAVDAAMTEKEKL